MSIDNVKDMTWSYSRITSYAHCPYEFYLNYIVNDDEIYLSEGNFYAEIGSYVHEILAMIFLGQISLDDAAKYFLDHYDENVFYRTRESTMHKTITAIIDYFATVDFQWLKQYEILGVETKQVFEVNGQPFVGFIDLLLRDKEDGRLVIVDHKSTEYPFLQNGAVKKKLQNSFEQYKKQMYLYAHAIHESLSEFPKSMMWNHFKDGGRLATIEFNEDDYHEAMLWFTHRIEQIKAENDYEPNMDYFYCHNLCNFRHSCEYCLTQEVE